MDKAPTSRRLQALETHKRIFDVTKELVDCYGIAGVSIRGIAERAEISVGTFYHYYASKDEVIYSMLVYIKEEFIAEIRPILNGETYCEKILDLIVRDLDFMQNYITTYKDTLRAVLRARSSNSAFSDYLFSDSNPTYKALRELVKAAKEAGEFGDNVSIDDACTALQTIIWAIVDLYSVSSTFDMTGHAKRVAQIILHSLVVSV